LALIRHPVQICAYLKYKSGWGTVTTVNSGTSGVFNIHKAGPGDGGVKPGNQFYHYQKPGVATSISLSRTGNNREEIAACPAAGLAIWHVDELGNRDNLV